MTFPPEVCELILSFFPRDRNYKSPTAALMMKHIDAGVGNIFDSPMYSYADCYFHGHIEEHGQGHDNLDFKGLYNYHVIYGHGGGKIC